MPLRRGAPCTALGGTHTRASRRPGGPSGRGTAFGKSLSATPMRPRNRRHSPEFSASANRVWGVSAWEGAAGCAGFGEPRVLRACQRERPGCWRGRGSGPQGTQAWLSPGCPAFSWDWAPLGGRGGLRWPRPAPRLSLCLRGAFPRRLSRRGRGHGRGRRDKALHKRSPRSPQRELRVAGETRPVSTAKGPRGGLCVASPRGSRERSLQSRRD